MDGIEKFTGRHGFAGKHDELLMRVPYPDGTVEVYLLDHQIRFQPETKKLLYETEPKWEEPAGAQTQFLRKLLKDEIGAEPNAPASVEKILEWCGNKFQHACEVPGGKEGFPVSTEEDIIKRGWAWCNENARVFVLLAEAAGFPARMVYLYHKCGYTQHTASEVFVDGRWGFFDPTFPFCFKREDNIYVNAYEISIDASLRCRFTEINREKTTLFADDEHIVRVRDRLPMMDWSDSPEFNVENPIDYGNYFEEFAVADYSQKLADKFFCS